MHAIEPSRRGAIGLDDLIALNEEIAALARSGMPMERGLLGIGGDLPGRLGAITSGLGRRMERGASLVAAIDAEGAAIPPTYRAVVEAGVRSGRLAEALEGLAGFARAYVEMRRAIGLALLYPTLVALLGYGVFLLLVVALIPLVAESFATLRVPVGPWVGVIDSFAAWAWVWGPILPALFLLGAVGWWTTGRASAFRPGRLGRGLRWVPGVASILDSWVAGQFADWLALLVEHEVPWPVAVRLAAEATGEPRLIASASAVADASERGEPLRKSARGLPPLLAWLMSRGGGEASLAASLRHAAATYRERAARKAAMLRATLPAALMIGLGASTALLYALTLFAPWTALLRGLSRLH